MPELSLFLHLHGSLLALVLFPAAIYDGLYRRIPNWLTFPAMALGLALNGILHGLQGITFSAVGMGIALILYGALFFLRGMGAGDVKLMMAVGAIVGPRNWAGVAVCTAVLGLIAGICLIVTKRRGAETFANLRFIVGRLFRLKVPHHERPELQIGGKNAISMPHGIVIGLGTAAYLGTAWVLTDF